MFRELSTIPLQLLISRSQAAGPFRSIVFEPQLQRPQGAGTGSERSRTGEIKPCSDQGMMVYEEKKKKKEKNWNCSQNHFHHSLVAVVLQDFTSIYKLTKE